MTGPSADSLVVAAEDEDVRGLDSLEGAGLLSSLADINEAVEQNDPMAYLVMAAGVGLDALGFVTDPFDALGAAGMGWLIEHVWWLHEPLDALAGDPTQIVAQARTWHNVAVQLDAVAGAHRGSAARIPGWEGEAGDAYLAVVADFTQRLDTAGDHAGSLAQLVLATGSVVGTERALIRDAIAALMWKILVWLVGAIAAAAATSGFSLAAAIAWVTAQCAQLAADIGRRLVRLISDLDDALARAGTLRASFEALPRRLERLAELSGDLTGAGAAAAVEVNKQHLGFRRTLLEDPPA